MFYSLGLPSETKFDAHYGWTGQYSEDSEMYYFRGFKTSLLKYNQSGNEWRLTLYTNPSIYGINNQSENHYPFGEREWYFFNTNTQRKVEIKRILNLNPCNPVSEFNCADGTW